MNTIENAESYEVTVSDTIEAEQSDSFVSGMNGGFAVRMAIKAKKDSAMGFLGGLLVSTPKKSAPRALSPALRAYLDSRK